MGGGLQRSLYGWSDTGRQGRKGEKKETHLKKLKKYVLLKNMLMLVLMFA